MEFKEAHCKGLLSAHTFYGNKKRKREKKRKNFFKATHFGIRFIWFGRSAGLCKQATATRAAKAFQSASTIYIAIALSICIHTQFTPPTIPSKDPKDLPVPPSNIPYIGQRRRTIKGNRNYTDWKVVTMPVWGHKIKIPKRAKGK